ncbi:MAG: 1-acylglycerol-3-phosphate O-acyltransferase [Lachnospiraceae bacterium]|nr:1-acylglycerol-3-phosphate O-acyltransferase [Lachnospiraceae bacterium]
MIRFLFTSSFVILFLIFSVPILLIEWVVGKHNPDLKNKTTQAMVKWAFRGCSVLAGVSLDVIGMENIPQEGAVLYVGNHSSYFDIVLTYLCFPRPTGYVAKVEMEKLPLLSVWMKNIHCLFLNRDNIKEGMKAIMKGIEELKSGISICIFPEGTRNTNPDMILPFREGSFRMAEKAKCPIIPICINNSSAVWEAHLPTMKKAHVIIEFGKPIHLDGLSREERKFLGAHTRKTIQEMYDRNKKLI